MFFSLFSFLLVSSFFFSHWKSRTENDRRYFPLDTDHANRFLKRTFFHPGSTKCEEQKREAREDYEERCEPSFPLFRNTGTRRYCPDIHDWKEFDNYEIGDGFSSYNPLNLDDDDDHSTTKTTTRDQYNRYRRPTVSTTTENPVDIPDHDE